MAKIEIAENIYISENRPDLATEVSNILTEHKKTIKRQEEEWVKDAKKEGCKVGFIDNGYNKYSVGEELYYGADKDFKGKCYLTPWEFNIVFGKIKELKKGDLISLGHKGKHHRIAQIIDNYEKGFGITIITKIIKYKSLKEKNNGTNNIRA